MPKLINTRTRIADLGEPRVVLIGGGFGGLAIIGCNKAVADLNRVKIQALTTWLFRIFTHAASRIGFKHKFFVLLSWTYSSLSYDKSNRLISARPKDGVH